MELLKDRNYYRLLSNGELQEQSQIEPTAELAVVLAERLASYEDEYTLEYTLSDFSDEH